MSDRTRDFTNARNTCRAASSQQSDPDHASAPKPGVKCRRVGHAGDLHLIADEALGNKHPTDRYDHHGDKKARVQSRSVENDGK